MKDLERRSALLLGTAATATLATAMTAAAQTPAGVTVASWGKRDSMIPGFKSVSMRDVIYQPKAKTNNPSMPNAMVCHVPEGELRVTQTGMPEFIAKKGDVWTCSKGIGESLENIGTTIAIMRIIDLIE
jgi:quercetin dioxygenase-like cupin family protein